MTKSRTKRPLDGSKQKDESYHSQVYDVAPQTKGFELMNPFIALLKEYLSPEGQNWNLRGSHPAKSAVYVTFIWKNRSNRN